MAGSELGRQRLDAAEGKGPFANVDKSMAVDLSDLKEQATAGAKWDKLKHQHRFVWVQNFGMPTAFMKDMAELRRQLAERFAAGESEEALKAEFPPLIMPLYAANLIASDGPGCMKCGLGWTHEMGYGKLCRRSDDDFGITEAEWPTQMTADDENDD